VSPRARTLVAVAAAALLLALPSGAHAHFTASGSTRATATIATLPAPTITSATPGSANVRLEWSEVTAPDGSSVTYYVTRDDGAPSGDCPSVALPRGGTSCTDTSVSNGRHDYTVTAVWRSWRSSSATASATVTHGPATQLVFTTQPGDGATGGLAFPRQPVVTALDASGITVSDYAGTVRLTIQSGGAAGAVLSGCIASLANGVTRFSGCEIDRSSGSNYVLRASDGTLGVNSLGFSVRTGLFAQFRFSTHPGNGTGGSEFSPQPDLTATDAGGNTVTSYSGTPRLSIVPGTGTPGAVLSQCDIDDNDNGVIEFDNCEIDRAGTGYRLLATDGAATGESNAFNVTVGSLADIRFTTQPGGGATGGLVFPTQPVVTAVDAGGNTVTSYTGTPVLTIASGPSGADLEGCVGTRVSGVVTFSGCTLDRNGTYELRADDGPRDDESASFSVDIGPLVKLGFTAQPTSATAGTTLSPAPRVTGTDAGGNPVAGYSGTIAITVERDASALTGCTSSVSSGTTTFSNCRITTAASGYVLHASDGTLVGDSAPFTVNAGSATSIRFTTQPGGGATGGLAFPTQPVVTAYDAFGNVATGYASTVSLTIVSGTGTAGASLTNCSRTLTAGVSSFRNCEINRVGEDYVLRASDGTRTANSDAFDVTAGPAAALQLAAATTSPVAGADNGLTMTALDAGGNVATSYAGSRRLTFGGAGRSPSGASPTVTDSSGAAIAFGAVTSIDFAAGVARASSGANGVLVLRDADQDVDVTVDDDGSLDDELRFDVATGAAGRLAWTAVNSSNGTLTSPCFFTCTKSRASDGATFQARVVLTDSEGNTISSVGSNRRVTVSTPTSGAGSGGRFSGGVLSVTLTFASSGSAITTSSFTFTNASGSWTQNTVTAASVAPDAFTPATLTVNND
jgi:trimeric autotransporter adhesin